MSSASLASPVSPAVDAKGVDAEAALKTTTKNLQVLRDRFAKLNEEHLKLKQLHESVPNSPTAATNGEGAALAGYLGDVVGAVQALFNSPKFSDIVLVIDNKRIPAHKFLLKARSKFFRDTAAAAIDDVAEFAVEEEGVSADIFLLLLRFLYTDAIDFASVNDVVGVQMLALADTHGLGSLRSAMESTLVSLLSRKNCTRLFFEANRLGAKELRQAALEIILNEFENIDKEDFDKLEASLMGEIFRARTKYFIHLAVKHGREDVVFLYLLEPELQKRIDELDDEGLSPLQVALRTHQESIASSLIERGANPSLAPELNRSILMVAIEEGDAFSALFLLKHGANIETAIADSGIHPLHMATKTNQIQIVTALLDAGADVNAQAFGSSPESDGTTPLHLAVRLSYKEIVDALLKKSGINVNVKDRYNNSCLWHSLASGAYQTASALLAKGANANEVGPDGTTILHRTVKQLDLQATKFLLENGSAINQVNQNKESALHYCCATKNKSEVLQALIEAGADVAVQNNLGQTPAHVALSSGQVPYAVFLLSQPSAPLDLLDNDGNNLLWLAMQHGERALATSLVEKGASLSLKTQDGYTHLGRAIVRSAEAVPVYEDEDEDDEPVGPSPGDCEAIALFLIQAKAPLDDVDPFGQSALVLAILHSRVDIVRALCLTNSQLAVSLQPGNYSAAQAAEPVNKIPNLEVVAATPLSLALIYHAPVPLLEVLVKSGADVNFVEPGSDCPLLLRRIVEGDTPAVQFLLSNGAAVNLSAHAPVSWTKTWPLELPKGLATPLNIAALLNNVDMVAALVGANADLATQDEGGETPLHVALANRHLDVVRVLLDAAESHAMNVSLKNNKGQTVFGLALALRDLGLAQALSAFSNGFSTEIDERTGLTFLQRAIDLNDVEGAQFLLQIKINVINPGRHPNRDSPMHMAAARGLVSLMELILRTDPSSHEIMNDQGRTPLHLAALSNHLVACDLLVRQPRCVAQDVEGNTALHLAIAAQHWALAHLLIEKAPAMGKRVNTREQLPIHVLARAAPLRHAPGGGAGKGGAKSKSSEALVAMLELLCQAAEDVDVRDGEGNTALLKAFLNANEIVAVELMRRGGSITAKNHAGQSIMDHIPNEGASEDAFARLRIQRQLFDLVDKDMPWQDGPVCELCQAKFTFQKRKHHCRHCGRVGCSNCLPSNRQFAIAKFGLTKPERLCAPCYDYLSVPAAI